jgi:hypothetical protein
MSVSLPIIILENIKRKQWKLRVILISGVKFILNELLFFAYLLYSLCLSKNVVLCDNILLNWQRLFIFTYLFTLLNII